MSACCCCYLSRMRRKIRCAVPAAFAVRSRTPPKVRTVLVITPDGQWPARRLERQQLPRCHGREDVRMTWRFAGIAPAQPPSDVDLLRSWRRSHTTPETSLRRSRTTTPHPQRRRDRRARPWPRGEERTAEGDRSTGWTPASWGEELVLAEGDEVLTRPTPGLVDGPDAGPRTRRMK